LHHECNTELKALGPGAALREHRRMDRDALRTMLSEGLSLAEIGRRVGRHEATVAYWVRKHGLRAANADRHRARGAVSEERLRQLVERGLSIAQIADELGRGKASVRHWLRRYGLRTRSPRGRRVPAHVKEAQAAGIARISRTCPHHGQTAFSLVQGGRYRCTRCMADGVARRRRRVKEILVAEAGGACSICGYDRCMRALHFHHIEPTAKRREINARGAGIAIATLRAEAKKCVLLCSNCHMEVEAGFLTLEESRDRA
jgi:transposase